MGGGINMLTEIQKEILDSCVQIILHNVPSGLYCNTCKYLNFKEYPPFCDLAWFWYEGVFVTLEKQDFLKTKVDLFKKLSTCRRFINNEDIG